MSNIWIAASEGNLERVRELLDQGLSPNESDENGYTPCFAAASWHHAELLRFLVEDRGADVNMRDPDGDTPLFVVESVRMAQLLIELGADPTVKNDEGLTAAESLEEDHPEIAEYLISLNGRGSTATPATAATAVEAEAQSDTATDALLSRVNEVMQARTQGTLSAAEADTQLRRAVEDAVFGQVASGQDLAARERARELVARLVDSGEIGHDGEASGARGASSSSFSTDANGDPVVSLDDSPGISDADQERRRAASGEPDGPGR